MNYILRILPLNLSALKNLTLISFRNYKSNRKLKEKNEPSVIKLYPEPKSNKPDTLLWLDDRINPMERRMDWLAYSPIGRKIKVIWVKNFIEFENWILNNGLPDAICFDYDLGEDTPSGYDCAKWLIGYCQENQVAPPLWSSQSTNPEGKAKINRMLRNYLRHLDNI